MAHDLVVVHEAPARHNLVVGQAYFSLWVLGAEAIERLGTHEQKDKWLPRAVAGAKIAFALTEPGSGSDAAALRTSAVRDGADFVVNGSKVFITGAAASEVIITAVRTSNEGKEHRGITLLLIAEEDPHAPRGSARGNRPGGRLPRLRRLSVHNRTVPSRLRHPKNSARTLGREGVSDDHLDSLEPPFGDTTCSFNSLWACRVTANSVSSSTIRLFAPTKLGGLNRRETRLDTSVDQLWVPRRINRLVADSKIGSNPIQDSVWNSGG